MKYFFLAYAIIAALFIGLMPMRGSKSPDTPIRLFPDMDEQDKLKPQKPDAFFADGQGARQPVHGTQALGFNAEGASVIGGIPEPEFGGGTSYYATGGIDGYFANGMPEELGLTAENTGAFLKRGEEVKKFVNPRIAAGEGVFGYAFNSALGGAWMENIEDPAHTALIFESKETGWNAHGDPVELQPDPELDGGNLGVSVEGNAAKLREMLGSDTH